MRVDDGADRFIHLDAESFAQFPGVAPLGQQFPGVVDDFKIQEQLRRRSFEIKIRDRRPSPGQSANLLRDNLFERLAQSTKEELARINTGESNSRAGMLFLGIISETKTMVLQSRNLLKSRRYFIEQEGKVIRQKRIYE